ncbi:hypothetical protein KY348_02385 [Candidatus Woesearchaeota archaeon]|nr:hypothetical protein [Candidatus Woesearchaeota archaeon]
MSEQKPIIPKETLDKAVYETLSGVYDKQLRGFPCSQTRLLYMIGEDNKIIEKEEFIKKEMNGGELGKIAYEIVGDILRYKEKHLPESSDSDEDLFTFFSNN